MSSPGVIILAEGIVGGVNLRIEDNIGEAIHVHYGNLRIDLTIAEFYQLSEQLVSIMEMMIGVEGFKVNNYDAIFLSQIDRLLLNLESITFEEVNLSNLLTDSIDENGNLSVVSIWDSRVSKAIKGNTKELRNWKQINYYGETNVDRLNNLREKIRKNGYNPDFDGTYIVLCDDGFFIADGCHRASILLDEKYTRVKIARWKTKDNSLKDSDRSKYLTVHNNELKQRKKRIDLMLYILNKDLCGKKVLIKGAGIHTEELLKYQANYNFNVIGIQDNKLECGNWKGIPVISKQDINRENVEVIFISSYKYRKEMIEEMEEFSENIEIYSIYENGIDVEFFR